MSVGNVGRGRDEVRVERGHGLALTREVVLAGHSARSTRSPKHRRAKNTPCEVSARPPAPGGREQSNDYPDSVCFYGGSPQRHREGTAGIPAAPRVFPQRRWILPTPTDSFVRLPSLLLAQSVAAYAARTPASRPRALMIRIASASSLLLNVYCAHEVLARRPVDRLRFERPTP